MVSETVESSSSDDPKSVKSSNQEPVTQVDMNKFRESKPGNKRLLLTLSVLLSFLFGAPFLIKSTEIYRSPLPLNTISSLLNQLQINPLSFPCNFQVVFLGLDREKNYSSYADKLGSLLSEEMNKLTIDYGTCGTCGRKNRNIFSITIDSGRNCIRSGNEENTCLWTCGSMNSTNFHGNFKDDETVDEFLYSVLQYNDACPKIYTMVVINSEENLKVTVGKYRHAWLSGRVSDENIISPIVNVFDKFFKNGGKDGGQIVQDKSEFIPTAADGNIVLSFNLLNSNPNDWIYDWDFKLMEDFFLSPVVEALTSLANIRVESQVLYHTPKSSFSHWDTKFGSHISRIKDLPFFVNSNEWHLDTSVAATGRSKILQFVVYVPSRSECPLTLQLPSGEFSKTNGFVSPMWGGLIIWNPPACSNDSHSSYSTKDTLSFEDLQHIFQIFLGQFRQLFGLKADNNHDADSGVSRFLASKTGFAEWELDVLFRQHSCFNLVSCVTTLDSLSRLVKSLPRMIVNEEIGKQVKLSLEASTKAQNSGSQGAFNLSAAFSRQARALAEEAFFHPSITSISYSSFEHYFAIYMPFFAPVLLHVLLAAVKEIKRYKVERAKYSAWIDQHKMVS